MEEQARGAGQRETARLGPPPLAPQLPSLPVTPRSLPHPSWSISHLGRHPGRQLRGTVTLTTEGNAEFPGVDDSDKRGWPTSREELQTWPRLTGSFPFRIEAGRLTREVRETSEGAGGPRRGSGASVTVGEASMRGACRATKQLYWEN